MNAMINFLLQKIAQSPNLQNNPNAQQWIQVIQNGDAATGQQIARNIAQSYGMTPEQASQQAQNGLMSLLGRK